MIKKAHHRKNQKNVSRQVVRYCRGSGVIPFIVRIAQWVKYAWSLVRHNILPQGLLYRFILIIVLPLVLLQALVLVFFFNRHWDTISRRLAQDVSGEIGAVATLIQEEEEKTIVVDDVIKSLNRQLSLDLSFDQNGKMPPLPPQEIDSIVEPLMSSLSSLGYPFLVQEIDHRLQAIWIQLDKGVLKAVVPRKRFFSSTVDVFLVWMVGFSILLFWIAFLFMKNQVRSIERLSHAAELFGSGQGVGDFKPGGATEVKQAGLSFLRMQDRIQRYLTERTAMLSGVSHDLRTPLTRMKLQLSMVPNSEVVSDLLEDVTEMEHMLNAYLSFARGEGKEAFSSFSLNELILEIVEKLTKTGQKIDFHQEQSVEITARYQELGRAITNILTNAGRYATQAKITLGLGQNMVRLIIDDDGPGIPEKKRVEVFKAFYRIESSRNTKTGGIGLGLTITRDIILSHGGEILMDESPMGGLRVIVRLPIAKHEKKN